MSKLVGVATVAECEEHHVVVRRLRPWAARGLLSVLVPPVALALISQALRLNSGLVALMAMPVAAGLIALTGWQIVTLASWGSWDPLRGTFELTRADPDGYREGAPEARMVLEGRALSRKDFRSVGVQFEHIVRGGGRSLIPRTVTEWHHVVLVLVRGSRQRVVVLFSTQEPSAATELASTIAALLEVAPSPACPLGSLAAQLSIWSVVLWIPAGFFQLLTLAAMMLQPPMALSALAVVCLAVAVVCVLSVLWGALLSVRACHRRANAV